MFALLFNLTQQMPFPDILAKGDKGKKKTEQVADRPLPWNYVLSFVKRMGCHGRPASSSILWGTSDDLAGAGMWARPATKGLAAFVLFLTAQRQRSWGTVLTFLQSCPASPGISTTVFHSERQLHLNWNITAVCTEFLQHQRNVHRDSWFSCQMFFILILLVFYSSIKAIWTQLFVFQNKLLSFSVLICLLAELNIQAQEVSYHCKTKSHHSFVLFCSFKWKFT